VVTLKRVENYNAKIHVDRYLWRETYV
jgi:hypothetical protein